MNQYTKLARQAVENYIKDKRIINIKEAKIPTSFLKKKSGVFVSIYNKEKKQKPILRGCIGTFLPTQDNIALEIIKNAIAAATQDYRFPSIQKNELPQLVYSVDILSAPELVSNFNELNPKKYGIIIKSSDGRTGLLLPDLDGVDTIEKQIGIAAAKAGINPIEEKVEIYRFTVERYKE